MLHFCEQPEWYSELGYWRNGACEVALKGKWLQFQVPKHRVYRISNNGTLQEVRQPSEAGGSLGSRISVQFPLHCGKSGLCLERLSGWQRALGRHFWHHTQISQGPPPAGFNCQALRREPGFASQAVLLHPRPGRAWSRAAGLGRPLPLEFPNRGD